MKIRTLKIPPIPNLKIIMRVLLSSKTLFYLFYIFFYYKIFSYAQNDRKSWSNLRSGLSDKSESESRTRSRDSTRFTRFDWSRSYERFFITRLFAGSMWHRVLWRTGQEWLRSNLLTLSLSGFEYSKNFYSFFFILSITNRYIRTW